MKKRLTDEQINKKKNELIMEFEKSINEKKKRKTPARIFLQEIKDILEYPIQKGVSYAEISRKIQKVYKINISADTIRHFVYSEFNIKNKQIITNSNS